MCMSVSNNERHRPDNRSYPEILQQSVSWHRPDGRCWKYSKITAGELIFLDSDAIWLLSLCNPDSYSILRWSFSITTQSYTFNTNLASVQGINRGQGFKSKERIQVWTAPVNLCFWSPQPTMHEMWVRKYTVESRAKKTVLHLGFWHHPTYSEQLYCHHSLPFPEILVVPLFCRVQ